VARRPPWVPARRDGAMQPGAFADIYSLPPSIIKEPPAFLHIITCSVMVQTPLLGCPEGLLMA
jgi:hypothetical protein